MTRTDEMEAMDAEAFITSITRTLPVGGGPYSLDTSLSELPRDKVSRAAVTHRLQRVLGDPPSDLVASVHTIGDAYEWYLTRHGSGTLTEMAPRTTLRPLRDADIPALYEASTRPDVGYRWRFRGATPGFGQFASQLFDGVLAQFAVEDADHQLCGLVTCYGAQTDCRFAYIGFLRTSMAPGKGEVLDGMLQFIEFLFNGWDFRKLYADVPEYNATGMFAEESPGVRIEGRLKEHLFHDGQWWDMLIVALWRDEWMRASNTWFAT